MILSIWNGLTWMWNGCPTALTVDSAQGETLNYWWHLRLANLIPTPPPEVTMVAQPLNPFSGVIGVQQDAMGFRVAAICR